MAVILLIWAVGYFAVNSSQKALQKSIIDNSVLLSNKIMDEIDRDIYNRIEIFREYGRDLILQKAVLESNKEFAGLDNIQGFIDWQDREWTSVPKKTITPFMHKLINNQLSRELREKKEFYEQSYGHKIFSEIFVTNKYGANAAQTNKTTDYRQDDEEWWQSAKKDGLYISDIAYDESAGVYSTDIGIRINDPDGNFIGVMKVVLNIDDAINKIRELKPEGIHKEHHTIEYKLTTRDGKVIYSTENFKFLENVYSELIQHVGIPSTHAHSDYFIGEESGIKKLFIHAHSKGYRDYKGLGWVLIIEHRTNEIFAPITKLRNHILIILLIVTVVAVVMSFFISTVFAKPIEKLRDATDEISKSHLDIHIETRSNDEIGQLAVSFNKMTENLKKSREELIGQRTALKEKNSELSALYEVSSVISRTISMDKLLHQILDTLTRLELFNVKRKGGIFIIEGDRMNLAAHLGHTETFLNIHKGMKVGDCLCGLAAKTGEIVISKNSAKDSRHTFTYPEITPHGHIILPLKTRERVMGVLYLYISPDVDIDERKIALFHSIGSQIGIAIENSKLYEQTKSLSLHDPLTGLANRRLMHIIFEKNLAEARRFNKPFSILMLDIDDFKTYNDMKGHAAGDKLLCELANLISKEIRKVDLAVRYGGEEFLLLLNGDIKGAHILAEKIRKTVEAELGVTISLGISTSYQGTEEEDELINKADRALYQTKQKGKNRVEVSA
ncbi:MAG: diguanylate cyclase [Thermodesulfovibrionia bacterium]|nr:diguanylate cyclase [Thermodesulfovibrionia bacterium]